MLGAIIINLLWGLLYAVLLAGVVWLVIYGIEQFVYRQALPDQLKKGIWFIALLLVLIMFASIILGGASVPRPFLR